VAIVFASRVVRITPVHLIWSVCPGSLLNIMII